MSVLGDIISPQSGIISSIAELGGKLIDRLIPDPAAKAQAQLDLLKLQETGELATLAASTDLMKGQLAINTAEAASNNLFIAGWRPFVGWTCGLGLASQYVIGPFFTWFTQLINHSTVYPVLDLSTMLPLLIGMLGFGYYRSQDKKIGTANGS